MRRRTITGRNPVRLPAGNIPGWQNIFADDFSYTYAVGAIDSGQNGVLKSTSPAYAELKDRFTFYPDGWSTSHDGEIDAKSPNEPGYIAQGQPGYPAMWPAIVSKYQPTKTISFANSVARIRLHSESVGGVNTAFGAVIKPILAGGYNMGPYGRVSFRMRSTNVLTAAGVDLSATNNTTAPNLYWNWVPLGIDSGNWPGNGEFDFPEGGIDRPVAGNYHPAASTNQTYHVNSGESPYQWNIFTWEWTPGRFRWLVNNVVRLDTTDRVPTLATAFLFQAESDWRQPTGEGTIEIDWVSMWSYGDPTGTAGIYDSGSYDTAQYSA